MTKDEPEQNELRILVVEDDPDDAYLVKDLLSWDPHRVYNMDHISSLKNLTGINPRLYDVMLLDLGLKESQGLETLRRVVDLNLGIPIVVFTGANSKDLGEPAIAAGAQDYVGKQQITEDLLIRCIAYSIERDQMMKQTSGIIHSNPVSKLPNLSVLNERLSVLIRQNERQPINLALCLLQIDNLQSQVEFWGEVASHELVRNVAARLQQNMRASDLLCHHETNRFALVLTNFGDIETLEATLEKKIKTIQAQYVIDKNVANAPIKLKFSVGAAALQPGQDIRRLKDNAEQALQKAFEQREHRQIVIADPTH